MRLSKPTSGAFSNAAAGAVGLLRRVVTELLAITYEMARIPAAIFMRVAEAAGAAVLVVWGYVRPIGVAMAISLRRLVAVGERAVTPARAVAATAAALCVLLALSQFAALTETTIGSDAYRDVGTVAPAPEVASQSTGSSHAWLGLPLALAALVCVAACARGHARAALYLAAVGVAVVAMSLIVDLPNATDEGSAAVAYEGAQAAPQAGFWVQLLSGAVLVALAPLLRAYSGRSAGARAPRARRSGRSRPPARRVTSAPAESR